MAAGCLPGWWLGAWLGRGWLPARVVAGCLADGVSAGGQLTADGVWYHVMGAGRWMAGFGWWLAGCRVVAGWWLADGRLMAKAERSLVVPLPSAPAPPETPATRSAPICSPALPSQPASSPLRPDEGKGRCAQQPQFPQPLLDPLPLPLPLPLLVPPLLLPVQLLPPAAVALAAMLPAA